MQTSVIKMDRDEARQRYGEYLAAVHYGTGMDREIARAYRLLAQGKLLIRALESVRVAGLGEDGLPKLAICGAQYKSCHLELHKDGSAKFTPDRWERAQSRIHRLPAGSFQFDDRGFLRRQWGGKMGFSPTSEHTAIVPIVPANLRPKAKLSNYHILWEADWQDVPVDPMLIQRLGKGDLWVVHAAWNLTEVERAAMRAHV